MGTHARRHPTPLILLVTTIALGAVAFGPSTPARSDPANDRLSATLDGLPLALSKVASYHCHDLRYPVITCFRDAEDRDRDVQEASAPDSLPYVNVFRDENYGGQSYIISESEPNLTSIGWNDVITSFKSTNSGRPRFYQDASYGTPSWRWPAGAWVANVGSPANDKFSSVENAP